MLNVKLMDVTHDDLPFVVLSATSVRITRHGITIRGAQVIAPTTGHSVPSCADLLDKVEYSSTVYVTDDWQIDVS